MLGPLGILYAVTLAAPLALAIIESFSGGWSSTYGSLYESVVFWRAVQNSLVLGLTCAVLSVLLGYPAAWFIARRSPGIRTLLLMLLFTPLWTSIVARVYAWAVILQPNGILDGALSAAGLPTTDGEVMYSMAAVLISLLHVLLPYAIIPLVAAFLSIDSTIPFAARAAGASTSRLWWNVLIPLTATGAAGAFVIVFLVSLGAFVQPAVLGGPTNVVLATLISDQVRQFNMPLAGATSVTLMIGAGALLTLFATLARLRARVVG